MQLIGTGHDRSYFSSIAKRPMAGFLNTGIASEVKAFTVIKNKIRKNADMQIHTHTHTHTHHTPHTTHTETRKRLFAIYNSYTTENHVTGQQS